MLQAVFAVVGVQTLTDQRATPPGSEINATWKCNKRHLEVGVHPAEAARQLHCSRGSNGLRLVCADGSALVLQPVDAAGDGAALAGAAIAWAVQGAGGVGGVAVAVVTKVKGRLWCRCWGGEGRKGEQQGQGTQQAGRRAQRPLHSTAQAQRSAPLPWRPRVSGSLQGGVGGAVCMGCVPSGLELPAVHDTVPTCSPPFMHS